MSSLFPNSSKDFDWGEVQKFHCFPADSCGIVYMGRSHINMGCTQCSRLHTGIKRPGMKNNFHFSKELEVHPMRVHITFLSSRVIRKITNGGGNPFQNDFFLGIKIKPENFLAFEAYIYGRIWASFFWICSQKYSYILGRVQHILGYFDQMGSLRPFQPLPQQAHPSRGPQVNAGGSMEVGWNLSLDFLHAILKGFGDILGVFPIAGDPRA